jgi:2-oxoglutarate dehydrogenase E1 component
LTVWEAQFGDFANGAQIIIDNFLCCMRSKWERMSGIVLLLPHGYEGQGAEHSSARLERFLQLCAGLNMQVVYPSTPANHFHALRRQIRWPWRVPLVVMTPKSLLRHAACVSAEAEFLHGSFREVIDDAVADPAKVRRVVVCSGKLFYELDDYRRLQNRDDVAIVRLEQLYPFPQAQLDAVLSRYGEAWRVFVQEEPGNMGACAWLQRRMTGDWLWVSRPDSDATATGIHDIHKKEQMALVQQAFDIA